MPNLTSQETKDLLRDRRNMSSVLNIEDKPHRIDCTAGGNEIRHSVCRVVTEPCGEGGPVKTNFGQACEIDDGNCTVGVWRKGEAEPSEFVPGLRLPKSMTVDTFWQLLDLAPDDPLSTHIVRLVALQLGRLTDEDKVAIIQIFRDRLGIKPLKREFEWMKIEGIGIANRKDLDA